MSRGQPHPLSQPPITASGAQTPGSPTALPSPLPVLPLFKSQDNPSKDRGLHRRRSSFPPGVGCSVTGNGPSASAADGAAQAFPWVVGGTPSGQAFSSLMTRDQMSGYGNNLETSKSGSPWDGSLNLDEGRPGSVRESQGVASPSSKGVYSSRGESWLMYAANAALSSKAMMRTPSMERTASGSEHGWRVLLNRSLDVDGLGSLGVARVMSEVWKRGGPEAVSQDQGGWRVMALTV